MLRRILDMDSDRTLGLKVRWGDVEHHGQSKQHLVFTWSERRTRTSMGSDEPGGTYRRHHLKTTFSGNTTQCIGFERKFLHYAQGHDCVLTLLEESDIRLLDATLTSEDFLRNGLSHQRIRRAQQPGTSLLESAGLEVVEYLMKDSSTPAIALTRF